MLSRRIDLDLGGRRNTELERMAELVSFETLIRNDSILNVSSGLNQILLNNSVQLANETLVSFLD